MTELVPDPLRAPHRRLRDDRQRRLRAADRLPGLRRLASASASDMRTRRRRDTGRSRSPSRPTSSARSATSSSSPRRTARRSAGSRSRRSASATSSCEAEQVYRTTDDEHPGVAAIYEEGNRCIAGPIEVDALPDHEEAFMRRYQTTEESKQAFAERGWKRIVAFQTRNPIHRAHEYLTKAALEICDGLFIHPLIGKTKEGDIPADVRMRCYEVLMENYYPPDHVMLGRQPRQDALRRARARRSCTRSSAATTAAPTSSSAATTPASATTTAPTTRSRSSTTSTSTSSGSSRCSSSTPSGATSARAWPRRRPARTRRSRTCSSPGPRCARCSATARSRRTSSRGTRSPTS